MAISSLKFISAAERNACWLCTIYGALHNGDTKLAAHCIDEDYWKEHLKRTKEKRNNDD